MTAYIQAWTNGRLHPATEPSISPLDRGFLYGDAIYEVIRTYDGRLFAFREHLERLEASAAALGWTPPFTPSELRASIEATVAAYRERCPAPDELYIRLQTTRGAGPIGLDPALAEGPTTVLIVQRQKIPTGDDYARGVTLAPAVRLRRNPRAALDPAWKSGNYLNNILCLAEARSQGADEVLIYNLDGAVTEAAVANIAFVFSDHIATPPTSAGILHGITRRLVLEHFHPWAGRPWRERNLYAEDVEAAEECFLLSTTRGPMPVRAIGSRAYRTGRDSVGFRLAAAYDAFARARVRTDGEPALIPSFPPSPFGPGDLQ